jgi:hypothetical protein
MYLLETPKSQRGTVHPRPPRHHHRMQCLSPSEEMPTHRIST